MAKTLVYATGSPVSVKIGDTDTVLYLQIAKDNVNVDLTTVQSIQVKIADKTSFLKTISIDKDKLTKAPTKGVVELPLNKDNTSGLPDGNYIFEVWITTADSESEIYPDSGVSNFSIVTNVEGGSVVYSTLTLQDFENRFNELDANAQNALTISKSAQEISTAASDTATQAATDAEQTLNDLKNGNYAKKTDTVAAANKLASGAKINGTNFDGSADINVKAANDANIVHLDGAETISGAKTFSQLILGLANGIGYSKNIVSSEDLNNYNSPGSYGLVNSTPTNSPSSTTEWGILLVINGGGAIIQLYVSSVNVSPVFVRNYSGSPAKWSAWNKTAFDSSVAHITGTETIAGAKTFSSKIIASAGVAGNADTATKLNTPVAINGVSFDGSSSISVNPIDSGWQNGTLLNGATASKYQYRTIGGVVYVHVVNLAISTAGTSGIFQVPYIINGETIAEEDLATHTYSAATLMDVTNGVFSPLVSAAAGHYLSFSGSFPIN